MLQHSDLLTSYPVLGTSDLDEARAAVASRYCDHRLDLERGTELHVRHRHVRGAHVSLNVLGYGGDVAIEPGELRRFYLLQIPLTGAARVSHRFEEVDASPRRAVLLNPDRSTSMRWSADCTKLMLQIDAPFLAHVASEEISMPLPGPVRFDPAIDLTREVGRRIRASVLGTVVAVDSGRLDFSRQSLSTMSVERDLARLLLQHQPSNISHLLDRPVGEASSVHVRNAKDFIHARYFDPLRLSDIATAAGVHPRTLQQAFRTETGETPLSYLKSIRLNIARYRLQRRLGRESVTDVAYGCGYGHLGRFSQDYRARFGHRPSETA